MDQQSPPTEQEATVFLNSNSIKTSDDPKLRRFLNGFSSQEWLGVFVLVALLFAGFVYQEYEHQQAVEEFLAVSADTGE